MRSFFFSFGGRSNDDTTTDDEENDDDDTKGRGKREKREERVRGTSRGDDASSGR
jgi:hypothetical protein